MPLRRPLLLALLLAACSGAAEEEPEAPPRLVVTAEAARDVAVDRLVLLGDVEGEVDVRVFAELPERIRTLHVTEGSRVEAGDPLATLEATNLTIRHSRVAPTTRQLMLVARVRVMVVAVVKVVTAVVRGAYGAKSIALCR